MTLPTEGASPTTAPQSTEAATTTAPVEPTMVVFNLTRQDANSYVQYARRPAVPEVKSAIQRGLESSDPWGNGVRVSITREQADSFVRRATRPTHLWSGQTLKSIIRGVLRAIDEGRYLAPPEPGERAIQADDHDPDAPSLEEVVGVGEDDEDLSVDDEDDTDLDEDDEFVTDERTDEIAATGGGDEVALPEGTVPSEDFQVPEPDVAGHRTIVTETAGLRDGDAPNYEADTPDHEGDARNDA